jgi:hypothetical protein
MEPLKEYEALEVWLKWRNICLASTKSWVQTTNHKKKEKKKKEY